MILVPARAGSKRLPGKNKRILGGKPLILWTLETALGLPGICDVLVSTDDLEIAKISEDAGALVPWLRPPEIGTDTASTAEVALHAVNWYEENRGPISGVLLLQPTPPFRNRETIEKAISLYIEGDSLPVIGVTESHYHPLWSFRLNRGVIEPYFIDHGLDKRSQDLDVAYYPNGSIYLFSAQTLRETGKIIGIHNIPLIIPQGKMTLDIDTEHDFVLAEKYL